MLSWENTLEKLKILNYKSKFLTINNKKPYSRIYFTLPGKNQSHQFEDFIDLSNWLLNEITHSSNFIKREQLDDPNTTINKLLLALRNIDYPESFPVQKLKIPYGEIICKILDFLTDKALEIKGFKWKKPDYNKIDLVRIFNQILSFQHNNNFNNNLHRRILMLAMMMMMMTMIINLILKILFSVTK
jgi:hypothetical protein